MPLHPFATRPNFLKRNTAPDSASLQFSLENFPEQSLEQQQVRRVISQSRLPPSTAMPLLKSRKSVKDKELTSFSPFDLPQALVNAFDLRSKSKNKAKTSYKDNVPPVSPLDRPYAPGSKVSSATMPSIQYVMDTYGIGDLHQSVKNGQGREWAQENGKQKNETKKKKRSTIKLPMMPPSPSGSSYGSSKDGVRQMNIHGWEHQTGVAHPAGSATQPNTPSAPTFSYRSRAQSIPPPTTVPIPSNQPKTMSPSSSATLPLEPGSFASSQSHDIWYRDHLDEMYHTRTFEDVERGANTVLEQVRGRLEADGWGYASTAVEECLSSHGSNEAGEKSKSSLYSESARSIQPLSPGSVPTSIRVNRLSFVSNTTTETPSMRSWREMRKRSKTRSTSVSAGIDFSPEYVNTNDSTEGDTAAKLEAKESFVSSTKAVVEKERLKASSPAGVPPLSLLPYSLSDQFTQQHPQYQSREKEVTTVTSISPSSTADRENLSTNWDESPPPLIVAKTSVHTALGFVSAFPEVPASPPPIPPRSPQRVAAPSYSIANPMVKDREREQLDKSQLPQPSLVQTTANQIETVKRQTEELTCANHTDKNFANFVSIDEHSLPGFERDEKNSHLLKKVSTRSSAINRNRSCDETIDGQALQEGLRANNTVVKDISLNDEGGGLNESGLKSRGAINELDDDKGGIQNKDGDRDKKWDEREMKTESKTEKAAYMDKHEVTPVYQRPLPPVPTFPSGQSSPSHTPLYVVKTQDSKSPFAAMTLKTHKRRPSSAPAQTPSHGIAKTLSSITIKSSAVAKSGSILPNNKSQQCLIPRDESYRCNSPNPSTKKATNRRLSSRFSNDGGRKNMSAMSFLALDEVCASQVQNQAHTHASAPPVPNMSKFGFASGVAKSLGLRSKGTSTGSGERDRLNIFQGVTAKGNWEKWNDGSRTSLTLGQDSSTLDTFSLEKGNEEIMDGNEVESEPEPVHIIPPSERAKIGQSSRERSDINKTKKMKNDKKREKIQRAVRDSGVISAEIRDEERGDLGQGGEDDGLRSKLHNSGSVLSYVSSSSSSEYSESADDLKTRTSPSRSHENEQEERGENESTKWQGPKDYSTSRANAVAESEHHAQKFTDSHTAKANETLQGKQSSVDISFIWRASGALRDRDEENKIRTGLLPPPRPKRIICDDESKNGVLPAAFHTLQQGQEQEIRALTPYVSTNQNVDHGRSTFFDGSCPSPPLTSSPRRSIVATTAEAAQMDGDVKKAIVRKASEPDSLPYPTPVTPRATRHSGFASLSISPSNGGHDFTSVADSVPFHMSAHNKQILAKDQQKHFFMNLDQSSTSLSCSLPPGSPSSFPSAPASASISILNYEKERADENEEKEKQRKILVSVWLAAKPVRRSEQLLQGEGTAPRVLGTSKESDELEAGMSTGSAIGLNKGAGAIGFGYRRASLDGRLL
ncbi:uncharacterized protein L203_101185 [Cryptococcus depauperatus CBS 7841]|uniref:Uncharacterized protein n=1 Tax=Cryptococcus depauperatus CBS 7841 TaxID=1295531 RepID=A0A1E3IK10_9TREE|nr:hypothetical protein L203_02345 [Cryptococcus depauperatus CBS 7841]